MWADDDLLGDDMCQVREVTVADEDGVAGAAFFSSRPINITLEFDLARSRPVVHRRLRPRDDRRRRRASGRISRTTTTAPVLKLKPGQERDSLQRSRPGCSNSGRYLVNLRIGLHWIKWIVHSDDVLQFDVIADHGESLFLNDQARPGVVAPIIPWDVVAPAAGERALETAEGIAASS